MWFSAIPCLMCLFVGALVSLYKPQDPKKLNPELISPAFRKLFSWWPIIGPKIENYIDNTLQIGINYVRSFSKLLCKMCTLVSRIKVQVGKISKIHKRAGWNKTAQVGIFGILLL